MSKTVSTCILETNQIQGKPQENVFFHSLYRTEPEFISEFLRTAKSTSPIQICAIFSASGPDSLSAMLNIALNKELGAIVADTQKQPVLDFDAFAKRVVNTLNSKVCSYIVSKGGVPIKVSMTLIVIEGDILRVIHIGNTKAVVYRDNKIQALTAEQTAARRFVEVGAITPEQEKTHPERDTLIQYLGKMPQDGQLTPMVNVFKLRDGDEIILMGNGISKAIPQQMRNMVIGKPLSTEDKARELIISAVNYGVKFGLSVVVMKVESTLILPGDAVIASDLPQTNDVSTEVKPEEKVDPYTPFNEPSKDEEDSGDTTTFNYSNANKNTNNITPKKEDNKKTNVKVILIDVAIVLGTLLVFIGISFGISYLVMVKKGWITTEETTEPTVIETIVQETVEVDTNAYYEEQHILYAINPSVKIYMEADQASEVIASLNMNDPIVVVGEDATGLYYLVNYNDTMGYVLKPLMSEYEVEETTESTASTAQTSIPHGGEPTVSQTSATAATEPEQSETSETTAATEVVGDPTESTAETSATSSSESSATTESSATSETTAATSETTAAPNETPAPTETAPTEAPATEQPAEGGEA